MIACSVNGLCLDRKHAYEMYVQMRGLLTQSCYGLLNKYYLGSGLSYYIIFSNNSYSSSDKMLSLDFGNDISS